MSITLDGTTGISSTGGFDGVPKSGGFGTAVATTSGASFDFTGIPAGVATFTLHLAGVYGGGGFELLVQLGTAGGIVETGYISSGAELANTSVTEGHSTSGMIIKAALVQTSGRMTFTRTTASGNLWTQTHMFGGSWATRHGAGSIDLGAEVTQLRIKVTSSAFSAGTANISWGY